jgi:membrane protease YdiL (CAAX protease family)
MKAFLKQHRLPVFFVLAFALSWYPWVLALMQSRTSGPNPLGLLLAGIILTAVVAGRSGLREFFGRMVRGRVGVRWYAIALGMPVAICLIAAGIAFSSLPHSAISAISLQKIRELPERFLFILLFIGLGEESGWRGFALPELQRKRSPLFASLILAPVWAIWHLPCDRK